jgi:hypothetical protein
MMIYGWGNDDDDGGDDDDGSGVVVSQGPMAVVVTFGRTDDRKRYVVKLGAIRS